MFKAVGVLARLTFLEAARRKILLAALLLGVLFLVIYGLGLNFIRQEEMRGPLEESAAGRSEIYNFLFMAGLYVVNFLTVAMIVLTSVDTLSGEIQTGTVHTLVAKPLPRWSIVLGKWLGFGGMLTLYVLLMGGGSALLVRWVGQYTAPNLLQGLGLIWLNGLLMLTVTLMGGAVLSTLANGVLVFGLYGIAFIGGWIEQIGSVLPDQAAGRIAQNIGVITSLILPSEALWKRAAHELQSPLVAALGISPFSYGSYPSNAMIVYAVLYLIGVMSLAVVWFRRRDL
jgi:ABC-type transport system involved in multi-copper enzyme maturation permease subunit